MAEGSVGSIRVGENVRSAPGRFGHDVNFNGFAERNGSLHGGLRGRRPVEAVAPSRHTFGGRGGGGAVGQQEAHFNL